MQGSLADEGYFPLDYDQLDRETALRTAIASVGPAITLFRESLPDWLGHPEDALPETHAIGLTLERHLLETPRVLLDQCLAPSLRSQGAVRGLTATLERNVADLAEVSLR